MPFWDGQNGWVNVDSTGGTSSTSATTITGTNYGYVGMFSYSRGFIGTGYGDVDVTGATGGLRFNGALGSTNIYTMVGTGPLTLDSLQISFPGAPQQVTDTLDTQVGDVLLTGSVLTVQSSFKVNNLLGVGRIVNDASWQPLEVTNTVGSDIAIDLGDGSYTTIDAPKSFYGTFANFTSGDVIDLPNNPNLNAVQLLATGNGTYMLELGKTTSAGAIKGSGPTFKFEGTPPPLLSVVPDLHGGSLIETINGYPNGIDGTPVIQQKPVSKPVAPKPPITNPNPILPPADTGDSLHIVPGITIPNAFGIVKPAPMPKSGPTLFLDSTAALPISAMAINAAGSLSLPVSNTMVSPNGGNNEIVTQTASDGHYPINTTVIAADIANLEMSYLNTGKFGVAETMKFIADDQSFDGNKNSDSQHGITNQVGFMLGGVRSSAANDITQLLNDHLAAVASASVEPIMDLVSQYITGDTTGCDSIKQYLTDRSHGMTSAQAFMATAGHANPYASLFPQ